MSLPARNADGTIDRRQDVITRLQHTHRVLKPGLDAKYSFEPAPLRPREFPGLTPAQRLHLETRGYVVLENVLTQTECEALKQDIYAIEAAFRTTGDLPAGMDPNTFTFFTATSHDFFRVDNLPHLARSFYDYVTHPRLLATMEEICGTEVRLEQSDAAIRRPTVPKRRPGQRLGLHGGLRGYTGKAYQHTDKGLYHYTFVKTLTNLTDLGPEDGGTVVIPGSHKIDEGVDPAEIIGAAMENPEVLLDRVVAPAGSTLVFFESTIHASVRDWQMQIPALAL
jgi:hypothetical protein